jgi:hypothetical protein
VKGSGAGSGIFSLAVDEDFGFADLDVVAAGDGEVLRKDEFVQFAVAIEEYARNGREMPAVAHLRRWGLRRCAIRYFESDQFVHTCLYYASVYRRKRVYFRVYASVRGQKYEFVRFYGSVDGRKHAIIFLGGLVHVWKPVSAFFAFVCPVGTHSLRCLGGKDSFFSKTAKVSMEAGKFFSFRKGMYRATDGQTVQYTVQQTDTFVQPPNNTF